MQSVLQSQVQSLTDIDCARFSIELPSVNGNSPTARRRAMYLSEINVAMIIAAAMATTKICPKTLRTYRWS
ncbi:hypothetical protein DPMN_087460 [Dreissena polymorpha]|uniref:Uncharacterized protein n=1 Tax=Dreissena polymorpha TaxID=45954 RepID=A0A9D4KSU5_DREPO|nr:hypothetical protein DPMN_059854 [Dreissena polymorpha]KAH3845185.1 hypothetical protein DPMN_087460 [Dreissena polymorpha]